MKKISVYKNKIFAIVGGGILVCVILAVLSLIPPSLHATELSTICTSGQPCDIKTSYTTITNHSDFVANSNGIHILQATTIGTFTNYGILSVNGAQQALNVFNGYVGHFINYGTFANLDKMGIWIDSSSGGVSKVTNYGVMGSINIGKATTTLTLNNLGLMGASGSHISLKNGSQVAIQNYMVKISETAMAFNNFSKLDNTHNFSHLVVSANGSGGVRFKDSDSKIILDFGDSFEFGTGYLISKLATDTSGNPYGDLGVDFDRLIPKNDIYVLSQSGQYFIANLAPQYGAVGSLYKSNIRTMNNFYTISNSMIYPRKYSKSQNLRKSSLRADSQNLRGNPLALSSLRASVSERGNPPNQRFSQNLAQNPSDYYFILTPFINHNLFFESGRYNLRGFDYGFLTAFSARVAESNSLGVHFAFSYGNLNDKHDKDLSIRAMNFMLGVNYKLDLIWDSYLKARGDVFYFLNALDSATIKNIKPNNLGFGASVLFGKEWDFKQGGVLGIEAGLDYKALKSNHIQVDSQSYQKALYNLIYADLGVNYTKYFGGFGINLGGGFKANLAPNLAKSILLANSQNLRFVLDNDKILGYTNVALSYVLNHKNFDMEFSLAYYGNYGDRVISNGGGFEWRVGW